MTADPKPFRARARGGTRKTPLRRLVLAFRESALGLRLRYLRWLGMDVHPGCKISLKANLDFSNPTGVHIDDGTLVAFGAVILAHDMTRVLATDTFIGKNCFIGAHSIIMPGVRIGDSCIVGSGAVVTQDVPPNSIVAGNPAKIVRTGIATLRFGVLAEHHEAVVRELEEMRQEIRHDAGPA